MEAAVRCSPSEGNRCHGTDGVEPVYVRGGIHHDSSHRSAARFYKRRRGDGGGIPQTARSVRRRAQPNSRISLPGAGRGLLRVGEYRRNGTLGGRSTEAFAGGGGRGGKGADRALAGAQEHSASLAFLMTGVPAGRPREPLSRVSA